MLSTIKKDELKKLVDPYVESIEPTETRTCRIDLRTLNEFVRRIKAMKANGIRIYLTRPDTLVFQTDPEPNANNQLSFLIVPTTGRKGVRDLYKRKKILAMQPGGENSGLCPPYCP